MGYIYLITNKKNGKNYVGYTSRDVITRFNEHWRTRFGDNSILHKSMVKYGKSNFIVKELEQVDESNWAEREKYYIKTYNTLSPKGMNILEGGEMPPLRYGDKNNKSKITGIDFFLLLQDLKEYKLDFSQIAAKYKVSQSTIERINKGEIRRIENENYPIRKKKLEHYRMDKIIEDLIAGLPQHEIEKKYSIKDCYYLNSINKGKSGRKRHPEIQYPIRNDITIKNSLYYDYKPVETIPLIGK